MTPQLKAKLTSWVEHGLISADQAEKIVAHENRVPERPWVLYGIAGIGVTALVTGVISLVAANWDEISPWVKLACYFGLQAGVGYGFYRNADRPGLARETWLLLFASLVLAGIGLIAQIYNLHGDGWQALLLWAAITLPVVYLANSWAVVYLWLAGLSVASVIWGEADHRSLLPEFGRACVVATLPIVLVAIGYAAERYPAFNHYVRRAALLWGMTAVLFVGTPLANLLWSSSQSQIQEHLPYILLPWAALIGACAAAWFRPEVKRDARFIQVGLLLCAGLFLTLPLFHTDYSDSLATELFGAAGFFVTWVLAAAAAASSQHKRWFDFASLVIAVRVVVVYFEVFGSLAMTGVGLIISGGVILAMALAWHRFRGQVRQQLGGDA